MHVNQSWENAYCAGYEAIAGVPPVRIGFLGSILADAGWKGRDAGKISGQIHVAERAQKTNHCTKCGVLVEDPILVCDECWWRKQSA